MPSGISPTDSTSPTLNASPFDLFIPPQGDACNFKHPVADDRPNGHGMTGKAFRPRCDKSELLLKKQTHLGRRRLQAGVPPFPGGQVYLWRPVPVSARRRAQGRGAEIGSWRG